ncbi:MAG TPA: GNAT family N-acetyltransferase [Kofleriaceae bacterium]|nr:GNAT family N-acetyltransferase [Kofleriaceae bacterium]
MASVTRIRFATVDDVGVILGFICALADYEKLRDQVVATEDTLRAQLFGARPAAEVLIAERVTTAGGDTDVDTGMGMGTETDTGAGTGTDTVTGSNDGASIRRASRADGKAEREPDRNVLPYVRTGSAATTPPVAMDRLSDTDTGTGTGRGTDIIEPVGFALFFHSFSTFLAQPGLYLEDLFVNPAARGLGIGSALMAALARIAVDRGCGRFEWSVLDWNTPSIEFYRRLGSLPQSEWTVERLTGAPLAALAAKHGTRLV